MQAVVGGAITVLPGSQVTVTCPSEGIPTPTVMWSRTDDMALAPLENRTAMQPGVLVISNASINDSGEYVCTAKSEIGLDSDSTRITVIG